MLRQILTNIWGKKDLPVKHGNLYWTLNKWVAYAVLCYAAFLFCVDEDMQLVCVHVNDYASKFCHGRNMYIYVREDWNYTNEDISHPGLLKDKTNCEKRNLSFINNIPWLLTVLGTICLGPEYVYRRYEKGCLKNILWTRRKQEEGLMEGNVIRRKPSSIANDIRKVAKSSLCHYLFWICEGGMMISYIIQVYFINKSLYGQYLTFGIDVWKSTQTNNTYQMDFADIMVCTHV